MKKIDEEKKRLQEIVKYQQKHINVLKARNARLWHDLRLMMSQQEEYMRKNIELIKSCKGK